MRIQLFGVPPTLVAAFPSASVARLSSNKPGIGASLPTQQSHMARFAGLHPHRFRIRSVMQKCQRLSGYRIASARLLRGEMWVSCASSQSFMVRTSGQTWRALFRACDPCYAFNYTLFGKEISLLFGAGNWPQRGCITAFFGQ